jgi:hypothetical protein
MRDLVRGSLILVVLALGASVPRAALAHDTGYPHRHVYAAGPTVAPTLSIDRPGVYLGAGLVGNIVVSQVDTPTADGFISHGGGAQVFLGVRVHPYIGLEFAYAETIHNPVEDASGFRVSYLALHALTADIKLILPNRSNVRPYLQAGVGYYIFTREYQEAVSGGGIQAGVGVDIWLSPWWSLGSRVLYHGIKFDNVSQAGGPSSKPFLSTASLDLNLQFHF